MYPKKYNFYISIIFVLQLACFFMAGLSLILATDTKASNETVTKTLENVDFGGVESENKSTEAQRKRDSGYSYNKPIRFNRPRFNSGFRGRFSTNRNQLKRPFNQYGLPSTSQEQNHNHQRPHNQYRQANQFSSDNLQNQGVPSPIRHVDFSDTNPIASQNNEPFRIGTANYLPPKNQKLPEYATPNAFSPLQQESIQGNQNQQINQNHQINQNQQINNQNLVQGDFQDQRISDAALFLSQNAQTLSQLYGAPAPNQEYAPNNEYLNQANQSPNQQNFDNNLHSQTENLHGSQGPQGSQLYPGPLPSYASGILSSQETLQNIQSFEKDRLIAQLQQALINQAQFQNSETSGRNSPTEETLQQTGSGPATPGGPQLVSPSVFGGEQSAFGHTPFLSGSAISPPGFGLGYDLSTTAQGPIPPATTTTFQPQRPIGGGSSQLGSVHPASGGFTPTLSGVPQFGTYIPTLIPGTNFVANVPAFGNGFLSPGSVTTPNHPAGSSPTHFGIPIPNFPGQKPVSGNPTLILSPASPGRPGVQILDPGNPLSDTFKPVHPGGSPGHPVSPSGHPVGNPVENPVHPVGIPSHPGHPGHPGSNPVHPIANPPHTVSTPVHQVPVLPIGTIRPVATPTYPVATPVHPTYGVQPSFVNSLFIKPLKTVFPVYYYPNVPLQLQKPGSMTQPWNYAPTFQQTKPTSVWK